MPSVTYMDASAPFWDFVASLENQGRDTSSNEPWHSAPRGDNENNDHGHDEHDEEHHPPPPPPFGSWGWGHGFGGRGFPHRGPPGRRPPHHHEARDEEKDDAKDVNMDKENNNDNDNGEGPSGSGTETERHRRKERHGRCGKGRRGREDDNRECASGSGSESEGCARRHGRNGKWGEGRRGRHGWGHHGGPGRHGHGPPFGPFPFGPHGFGGPGPRDHGPHHGGPHHDHERRGRGGFGGPWGGRGGGFGGGFGGFNPWAFAAQFLNPENYTDGSATKERGSEDFSPEADIFDAPTTYTIHVSLPGVKKEDVGVNWDAEKSELSVAGVIYRPGDEEFLKTLAMDERKVGPFERKIRLGTRVNPAQIDAEGITAKLEDGILRIEVPKRLEEGFVEVRKVDIE